MRKRYKVYGYEMLFGSTLKELNYKECHVWRSLLDLACMSPVDGLVMFRDDEGYTIAGLAYAMKAPPAVVKSALDKLVKPSGRDNTPKITILDNNIIKINKWNKYQSEYNRQKPYRKQQDTWKTNFAKGMQAERDWVKVKEKPDTPVNAKIKELTAKIIKTPDIFNDAKKCWQSNEAINNANCKGTCIDKTDILNDLCKYCLAHRSEFKAEDIPTDWHNCEFRNYTDGKPDCWNRTHGIEKYSFCLDCIKDKDIWGDRTGVWKY